MKTSMLGLLSAAVLMGASGQVLAQTSGRIAGTASQPRISTGAEVSCLVEPSLEVNVGTPVDGVLEHVNVDRGDLVTPGQLLAKLNTGVEAATVEYQSAKAAFNLRKRQRNEDLQKKQLISTQELDEITTEQSLSELELRERRELLKLRTITSPLRGAVVDVYKKRGDLVKQEKIFRIVQLDPLHIETVLPAKMFGSIKHGKSYEVRTELDGARRMAKVVNVDRIIDAASGTFRVRLLLPNAKYDITPGQHCSVNF